MADPKNMSVADLTAFLAKVEDGASRDNALREAFLEVGTAVADILSLLEKQGPETARAIAAALKDIKVSAEMKMPEIRIDVKPTPVEVKPVINVPAQQAPVVQFNAPKVTGGWEFDVEPKTGGGFKVRAKRT